MVVGMVALALTGFAQADYAFKVLANKGANEYKSGGTWQPIKTGISLKVEDEVKVSENAYLGLVSATGKPVELKKPSNYKVADLLKQVGTGTSVMAKYTDFILSSNSAEAKKNRLSATGAVHRGPPTQLVVYLPEVVANTKLYSNSMYVIWEAPKSGGPYEVKLLDLYEDELLKVETPETSVKLDLSNPKFAKVNTFLIHISSKADPATKSNPMGVNRLSSTEQEKIKKLYAEEAGALTDDSALTKYAAAGFYEQHGLLIDALSSYEEAIRMAPDVQDFVDARNEFLLRTAIVKPKQ
jgi:hypothetical protein